MPTKTAYTQTPAGADRDRFARYAWDEDSTPDERRALMNAGQRLLEIRNMGETGLAELLFALVRAGYLSSPEGQNGAELSSVEGQEEEDGKSEI